MVHFFFAVDLLRKLKMKVEMSCIRLASYQNTQSTGKVNELLGIADDLTGRRVIIVEDIVDTGNTYEHIMNILEKIEVKDVRIATMLWKPEAYTKSLSVHYAAISIPSKFVIGRGLDYNGLGRNYTDIYQILDA